MLIRSCVCSVLYCFLNEYGDLGAIPTKYMHSVQKRGNTKQQQQQQNCEQIFFKRTPPVPASILSTCGEIFTKKLDFSCRESFRFGKNYQKGNLIKCRYNILLKNNIPSRR